LAGLFLLSALYTPKTQKMLWRSRKKFVMLGKKSLEEEVAGRMANTRIGDVEGGYHEEGRKGFARYFVGIIAALYYAAGNRFDYA
jgi:hypothetical protein